MDQAYNEMGLHLQCNNFFVSIFVAFEAVQDEAELARKVNVQNAQNEYSYSDDYIGGFIFRPDFEYGSNKEVRHPLLIPFICIRSFYFCWQVPEKLEYTIRFTNLKTETETNLLYPQFLVIGPGYKGMYLLIVTSEYVSHSCGTVSVT